MVQKGGLDRSKTTALSKERYKEQRSVIVHVSFVQDTFQAFINNIYIHVGHLLFVRTLVFLQRREHQLIHTYTQRLRIS